MSTFDALRDLDLVVEDVSFDRRERSTSSGFDRVTTIVELAGPNPEPDGGTDTESDTGTDQIGRGEDVTYEAEHHDTLQERGPWELAGEYTLESFSSGLDDVELFPDEPDREVYRNYRRWALESAALDLALRQADSTLADELGRTATDPNFVVSTSLDDDPDRVRRLLDAAPGLEFKLDPTPEWSDALVDDLAATGAVRVLDMKDQYEDSEFTTENPPTLYERITRAFLDAIIEDPIITAATTEYVDQERDRVAWDAPIHGIADCEALPWTPSWLNVKPSRFGTLESVMDFLDWADQNEVSLYGGGQFELGVGRTQIQELAAVFYPRGPNDIAPGVYNDPGIPENPPTPPIVIPADRAGFGWT